MKNKTAVDWIVEQLQAPCRTIPQHIIDKAKQIEKKQIIDSFGVGCHLESKRLIGYQDTAEEYYEKNFK